MFDGSFELSASAAHRGGGPGPSKEDNELEAMKKQGAIPKNFHRPLPPVPEPSIPLEGRSS